MNTEETRKLMNVTQEMVSAGFNAPKKPDMLDASLRKKINTEVYKFLKPTYFPDIPLKELDEILHKFGLIVLQEDGTPWSGMLLGRDAHESFELGYLSTKHDVNGLDSYIPIKNATLAMSWHKMNSGKYEIVGYIS